MMLRVLLEAPRFAGVLFCCPACFGPREDAWCHFFEPEDGRELMEAVGGRHVRVQAAGGAVVEAVRSGREGAVVQAATCALRSHLPKGRFCRRCVATSRSLSW